MNKTEYDQYIAKRKAKSEKNQKVQTMEEDLANVKNERDEIKSLLRELINGPNDIEIKGLEKSFAYQKIASEIDSCEDLEMLKNIAKSFAKIIL